MNVKINRNSWTQAMNNAMKLSLVALCLSASAAQAAGTIPLALAQQSDANGRPLAGALLYIYQVGTVATPQDSFPDPSLTAGTALQWPLPADSTGRIPMFYLADGFVHVRLTDANGSPIFDNPSIQVVGPSSGTGGGGGPGVDPTAIAVTGDIKFRITGTSETQTGWVKLNGQTIGDAMSGANTANATTQALFSYLWQYCIDAPGHCPVPGGRGTTALNDYNGHKQITLPDFRGRTPVGLDDMGAVAASRIAASNVTSGGTDGPTTPLATGGEANHALTVAELAAHNHTASDSGHTHQIWTQQASPGNPVMASPAVSTVQAVSSVAQTLSGSANIIVNSNGSGTAHNTMQPFLLGTWYMRL
jgi:microcystin-dependent protein